MKTNPNMMKSLKADNFYPTLITNSALNTDTKEPWWEGLDGPVPKNLIDWQGNPWDSSEGTKAAHPNSRFTVSIYNSPTLSNEFDNPKGVPISAIIIGGRRTQRIPLIVEGFNWEHGVFIGTRTGSETTAAATGLKAGVRRDPMAMLPFCGYNMGDYFQHWLNIGRKASNPPKIFTANWFRVDENGNFLWPGFGENIRILKWIIDRVHNNVSAKETPIGLIPNYEDLELSGIAVTKEMYDKLFAININEWKQEIDDIEKFLNQFGARMPKEIWAEFKDLKSKLYI